MIRPTLIVESEDDWRLLLEAQMRRLGYEPVGPDDSGPSEPDSFFLEPAWDLGDRLRGLGSR